VSPGQLVRSEGGVSTGDPTADEAYDGSGATYDLYQQVLGRNSIDDRGLRLDSSVHYMEGYDNAFWNGQQMVYGDAMKICLRRKDYGMFTIAIDVIGHELTHGVTQYEANLTYRSQSGVEQIAFRTFSARWLNSACSGTQRPRPTGSLVRLIHFQRQRVAIRSMKEPGTYDDPVLGKDPQPGHMNNYQDLPWYDNGGVHINSGIPNHAFYFGDRHRRVCLGEGWTNLVYYFAGSPAT
jgi:Zn-dependent metalloprotease